MSLQGKVAILQFLSRQGAKAPPHHALTMDTIILIRHANTMETQVAFNYVAPSSHTAAETLITTLREVGHAATAIHADISSPSAPETIIKATSPPSTPPKSTSWSTTPAPATTAPQDVTLLDIYNKLMDINVRSVAFKTQAILPYIPVVDAS